MSQVVDMTNRKFGRLTVLSRFGADSEGKATWNCICECGKTKVLRGKHLRSGAIISCGCYTKEVTSHRQGARILGQKFGKLTAVEKTNDRLRGKVVWVFLCDCGNTVRLTGPSVISGNTKSCGCLQPDTARSMNTTHGKTRTPTYYTWMNMRARCSTPSSEHYASYGGRGIKVCEAWNLSFTAFLQDMGEKPKGLTIGRINNDGDYTPDNCRWETLQEQARNKRSTVFINLPTGVTTLQDACIQVGIKPVVVYQRAHRSGQSHDDAFKYVVSRDHPHIALELWGDEE